jgi:Fibronectin type III domain
VLLKSAVVAVVVCAALLSASALVEGHTLPQVIVVGSSPEANEVVLARSTPGQSGSILAPLSARAGSQSVTAASAPTATIQVTYHNFPSNARAAFQAAVDTWQTMVVSSQVIHVNASWTSLGAGVLGEAGPALIAVNGVAYPAALYEAICSCNQYQGNEITATMNSSFGNWYLGTDGSPPMSKYDFESVVLHELGHGLGFLSSFKVKANGQGKVGFSVGSNVYPSTFDQHEWSAASGGSKLVSFASPSTTLANQLTDGSVYFDGPNVQNVLGQRARLYAPSTWIEGSSNSHLDEGTYGPSSGNALMTPALFNGEVEHDPGPLMLAMFRDIGWATANEMPPPPSAPGAPRNVTATPGNGSADVAWLPPASTGGSQITGYTVTSNPDAKTCASTGATSCTVNGLTNGTAYTFTVTATNSVGTGPASQPSSPVTPTDQPPDTTPASVKMPTLSIAGNQRLGGATIVHVSWPKASDPSGISGYSLQVKRGRHAWTSVALASPTDTSVDMALKHRGRYHFRVRATDGAGNVGPWTQTPASRLHVRQERSAGISYSGNWRLHRLHGAAGGHVRSTGAGGPSATFNFQGTAAAFVSTLGPNRGIVDVWLDGALVATLDLYAPSISTRTIVWTTGDMALPGGTHTIQLRPTGTHDSNATNSRIDLDAFLAWP